MGTYTTVVLDSSYFNSKETMIVEHGALRASVFRFSSGVCAVLMTNANGHAVILPYQGQQIWSLEFAGQSLAMRSIFDEPRQTQDYLSNYGAFFLHCGLLSMGNPGPRDNHPLHGELPNATYQYAYIRAGSDEHGEFLETGGTYRHSVAFTCDYQAASAVRLYENRTTVQISLEVTNLKNVQMEYMYLAHLNFKPVDHGRLVYTAPSGVGQVGIRRPKASFLQENPAYADFFNRLMEDPKILNVMDPHHILNPEVVMFYNYKADNEGWAHTMNVQPDGFAGYVKHRPEELNKLVRWIVRTGSEEALGMALPATAEPDGYASEKEKGNIRLLPANSTVSFHMEAGLLLPNQVAPMERHIADILSADGS